MANVLADAKPLIDDCPRCDSPNMVLVDLHLVANPKYYDTLEQCTECLSLFQHIYATTTGEKVGPSSYVNAVAFIYKLKDGSWKL